MDPVSNVDQLVLLLRQRLLERTRAAKGQPAQPRNRTQSPLAPTGLDNLQALAAIEGVDDRQLRRALVQSILADRLGGQLINGARFHQVVDKVTETMEAEAGASKLLSRLVGELRAQAR